MENNYKMISIEKIYGHWVTKYILLLLGLWLAFPQPKRNILLRKFKVSLSSHFHYILYNILAQARQKLVAY